MQQPGERRGQGQQHQQKAEWRSGLYRGDGERADDADADKGGDPRDAGADDDRKAPAPRLDDLDQSAERRRPADRGGLNRELDRRRLGGQFDPLALAGRAGRGIVLDQGEVALALLGLRPHQPAIGAVPADQFGVTTQFDDAAVIEDQDTVGADHARQPVRQDQGGAPGREPVEGLLDHRLVFGIDRRQRLVEDQDRRIPQQGAGDRQPLALAARQHDAALADHRLVALRQGRDELVRIGVASRRLELVPIGIGLAEPQILFDRAVEQIGVLVHHGDHPAHRLGIERPQIAPADQHRSRLAGRTGAAAGARPRICPSRSGRRCRSSRRRRR